MSFSWPLCMRLMRCLKNNEGQGVAVTRPHLLNVRWLSAMILGLHHNLLEWGLRLNIDGDTTFAHCLARVRFFFPLLALSSQPSFFLLCSTFPFALQE